MQRLLPLELLHYAVMVGGDLRSHRDGVSVCLGLVDRVVAMVLVADEGGDPLRVRRHGQIPDGLDSAILV